MIVDRITPVTAEFSAPTGVREVIDLSRLILERAPHAYKPTNTDGSVCRELPTTRTPTTPAARAALGAGRHASPLLGGRQHSMVQAADAAVDTALGILASEQLSNRATAALGLLMAADAALDGRGVIHLADRRRR